MPEIVFDDSKLKAILVRIEKMVSEEAINRLLLGAGKRMGEAAIAVGQEEYPPAPEGRPLATSYSLNGQPSKFKTVRQRKYFFAALGKGIIALPRRRTGQLGNSMTADTVVSQNAVFVTAGTNKAYAPYVIGPEQSAYHAETGWQQLDQAVVEHADGIYNAGMGVIEAYVSSLGDDR